MADIDERKVDGENELGKIDPNAVEPVRGDDTLVVPEDPERLSDITSTERKVVTVALTGPNAGFIMTYDRLIGHTFLVIAASTADDLKLAATKAARQLVCNNGKLSMNFEGPAGFSEINVVIIDLIAKPEEPTRGYLIVAADVGEIEYFDDVLEYADFSHFPGIGESGKIYVARDTNLIYRYDATNGYICLNKVEYMKEVTYAQLKSLRDAHELVPGMKYRIVDYLTQATQNTEWKSAEHPFDVVVTALNEYMLDENASVLPSARDTGYFVKIEMIVLSASWKPNVTLADVNLQYTIDEDGVKYDEMHETAQVITELGTKVDKNGVLVPAMHNPAPDEDPEFDYWYLYAGQYEIDGVTYDLWEEYTPEGDSAGIYHLTSSLVNSTVTTRKLAKYPMNKWQIKYSLDVTQYYWTPVEAKGAIYWMRDDRGNEAPYDFKNLMFKRFLVQVDSTICTESEFDGLYLSPFSDRSEFQGKILATDAYRWRYTFSYEVDSSEVEDTDASLSNAQPVYRNVIRANGIPNVVIGKDSSDNEIVGSNYVTLCQSSNNNKLVNSATIVIGGWAAYNKVTRANYVYMGQSSCGNEIGFDSQRILLGTGAYRNVLRGADTDIWMNHSPCDNEIGSNNTRVKFYSMKVYAGSQVRSNKTGPNCYDITIDNVNCHHNVFERQVGEISVGLSSNNPSLGFSNNLFRSIANHITIDYSVVASVFGVQTTQVHLIGISGDASVGDYCSNIEIENANAVIGDYVSNVSINVNGGSIIDKLLIDSEVRYVNVRNEPSDSSMRGNRLVHIHRGVQGTSSAVLNIVLDGGHDNYLDIVPAQHKIREV